MLDSMHNVNVRVPYIQQNHFKFATCVRVMFVWVFGWLLAIIQKVASITREHTG